MIELGNISPVGFGAYRISSKIKEHYRSLHYAFNLGCNLVDTASTYTNGESEQLIGKVISEFDRNKVFVITKAGYAYSKELEYCKRNNIKNIAKIDASSWYTLDVNYINYQLKSSIQRLDTTHIDGFLLHNPEYYLSAVELAFDKEKLYRIIKDVFSLLEEKVEQRIIRYYGISSNTLPFSTENANTISLEKLQLLANSVSSNNHFKLVQFPFNYFEQDALNEVHDGNKSVIDICKEKELISFCNRPLNANTFNENIRLVTYEKDLLLLDENDSRNLFESVFSVIFSKMKELGIEEEWKDFPILNHLHNNWNKMANPEIVLKVFREHFYPFVNSLFDNSLPESINQLLVKYYEACVLSAKKCMTERIKLLEQELIDLKVVSRSSRSFSYNICNYYLSKGINHVLVGMRNVKYVDDMKQGFCSV